jgi:hypothetical protein
MNTVITVRNHDINIQFDEYMIHVTNNDSLTSLLAHDTEAATDELVTSIKAGYLKQFNKQFTVSDASLAVEIWAHVYVEKFADIIKAHSSVSFIDALMKKIIDHCEIIDMGESGHDHNRFAWNALAPLKSTIAGLL